MKRMMTVFLILLLSAKANAQESLIWNTPGKDFHDALPLGNGDIGISAWAESDGDLFFYIGKTDAYDDNNRLLKLGMVRVKISSNPFKTGHPYREMLSLKQGEMTIHAGKGDDELSLRVWVDANHPAVHVDIFAKKNFTATISLENWRKEKQAITDTSFSDPFSNSIDGSLSTVPAIAYPDTVLQSHNNNITWFHHNSHSCWPEVLRLQGLEAFSKQHQDPLEDRIFGGSISGAGLVKKDDTTLVSSKPGLTANISIVALTSHPATAEKWISAINTSGEKIAKQDAAKALIAHHTWWQNFWNRSWIKINTQGDTGTIITRSYVLQQWLVACGGRGKDWVKYNGSIFNLPWEKSNADYRRWGSANWFQNARLPYWPMVATGNFDMLAPFFGTYLDALPLAKERTKTYYGHDGAFFSETSYAWGTYTNGDYGYDRTDKPPGFATNTYIRHYWSGGLELCTMMLDQYDITRSKSFFNDTLLPLASAIVRFYDQHWKRGTDGKIKFDNTQSLETWQTAVNPLPDIAGLKDVLSRLLALPSNLTTTDQRKDWSKTLTDLPAIPSRTSNDSVYLMPADSFGSKSNVEDPELYAVFPYRLYRAGNASVKTGINTFEVREFRENRCWWQDEIQAACLGLAHEAANGVAKRLRDWNTAFRFPAMWGPNNDEIPDLDHGGVGQMALQNMLLQSDKDKIYLFPAWPTSWDVSFKLYAPKGTIITAELRSGKLQKLQVSPESRRKDIVILSTQ